MKTRRESGERKRGGTVGTTSRERGSPSTSLLYILLLAVNSTDLHKETNAHVAPRLFTPPRESREEKKKKKK